MLTDEINIKDRWRKYFSIQLNLENATEQLGEVPAIEGPVQEISREEVIYHTTTARKHLEVHKDLFFIFVDLEKAYYRVPRDLVYWCLRREGSQRS